MSSVIYVPLEPMETRYTKYWLDGMTKALEKYFNNVITIAPSESPKDAGNTGVLDTLGTTQWKMWQLDKIRTMFSMNMIENGTTFFFADLWFPGIENVRYMADLLGIKINITGTFHGGSWVPKDYVEGLSWAKDFESMIIDMSDMIVISTYYHASIMFSGINPEYSKAFHDKMLITGHPIEYDKAKSYSLPTEQRENIVLYTQRIDEQKDTGQVLKSIEILYRQYPKFKFIMTSGTTTKMRIPDSSVSARMEVLKELMGDDFIIMEGLTREKYFELLGKSKVFVSMAIGETFGICLAEAISAGCSPVLSAGVTHNEMVMDNLKFICRSPKEIPIKIKQFLTNHENIDYLMARFNKDYVFDSMAYAVKFYNKR